MDLDVTTLRTDAISATISALGAEPVSLRDAHGTELLWQAGEQWRRHAPILFPAICRVGADDHLRVGGRAYPMAQHGFARDSWFSVVDTTDTTATYVLAADDTTRESFPFDFAFAVGYEVDGSSLTTRYTVHNSGDDPMPFSLGSHPAFSWRPERDHLASVHAVRFDQPEPGPYRRVEDNLLTADLHPSLAADGVLHVDWDLFEDGAVIMTDVASRGLRFGSAGGRVVRMQWDGFSTITCWTKPGAEFICVEPWRGEPAPVGYLGAWDAKPGNVLLAPGARFEASYQLTLE